MRAVHDRDEDAPRGAPADDGSAGRRKPSTAPRSAVSAGQLACLVLVAPLVGLAAIWLQAADGVVLFFDELGFLGEAVWMSTREGRPDFTGGAFYSSGWPALLAVPLSVLPFDPWLVAVATNLMLLAALGPLLFAFLRQLAGPLGIRDSSGWSCTAAAVAGACVPSVLLQAPRAWAEVCAAVGFALWATMLARHSRLGPGWSAVAPAAAAAGLVWVHRRFLAVVAITVIVVVVEAARRHRIRRLDRSSWAGTVTALGACIGVLGVGLAVDRRVRDVLYGGETFGERLGKLDNLASTRWIPTLLGHTWSMLAVTFGLAGVGVVVVLWLLAHRRAPVLAWGLGLAVGALAMTSVLFLVGGPRADNLVYERYAAPALPVLVALGALVVAGRRPPARLGVALSALGLVVAGGVLSVSLQESELTGDVQKLTVPALSSLGLVQGGWGEQFADRIHVGSVTLVSVVVLAVLGLSIVALPEGGRRSSDRSRSGPGTAASSSPVAAALAVVAFAGVVAIGSFGNLRPFVDLWQRGGRDAARALEEADLDVLPVAPGVDRQALHAVRHRLGYPEVVVVDPTSCPGPPLVLGPRRLADEAPELQQVTPRDVLPAAVYRTGC